MATDLLHLLSPQNTVIFILVMSRLSGMMLNAPFFSTFPIPMPAKIGLVSIVAFMTYPIVINNSSIAVPTSLLALSVVMAKEILIGMLIGFCAGLIFVAIQMAGQLLSIQIGLAVSNVLDPVTKQQVPVLGQLYLFLASLIFIYVNGHQWLFTSVYDSYHVIPIGYEFVLSGAIVERIIYFTSQIFTIAFGIIIPIYGVLFIADVTMGFISKAMPQMNIFMVALPCKIYVGLVLMVTFLMSTSVYLSGLIKNLLQNISSIFT